MKYLHLPAEILDMVASNLTKNSDIAAAALVNQMWYWSLMPVLYRHLKVAKTLHTRPVAARPTTTLNRYVTLFTSKGV